MKTLIEKGATVEFSDPYIAKCIDGDEVYTASPLVKENLLRADIVVITTDHTAFDYDLIHQYAPVIFDTKNAMGHFPNTGNYYRL